MFTFRRDNYQNNSYPLMIASHPRGSLATDSAVLKLSGKVFDKPFKGPVSLHTMHGHNASFIECVCLFYLFRWGGASL